MRRTSSHPSLAMAATAEATEGLPYLIAPWTGTPGRSAAASLPRTRSEVATSGEPSLVHILEYAWAVRLGRLGRMIPSRTSHRSGAGRSSTRLSPRNSRR